MNDVSSSPTTAGRTRTTSACRGRVVPVLLATSVLVAGVSLSADAGGSKKPVLAGKTTKSARTTTIKTTGNGPALRLRTKATKPPLAVTSRTRVAKLNADQVDGLDAADLATQSVVYRLPLGGVARTTRTIDFPEVSTGTHLMTYAVTIAASAAVTQGTCFLRQEGQPQVIGLSYAALRGSSVYATLSASGPVDASQGALSLVCTSPTSFVFDDSDSQSTVMFTRTALDVRDAAEPTTFTADRSGGGDGSAGR